MSVATNIRPPLRQPKLRVVVVDDSPVALQTICTFLTRYQSVDVVGTARDGYEALEAVRSASPNLVVMDVQMPRMNGLEAASIVSREHPEVCVIMVTVNDTAELRDACRVTGAAHFIAKHQLPQRLPEVLRSLGID